MQRELSSFDIYVIVSEFQDLVGGYIDNIYQLSQNEILIRVTHRKKKQKEALFARNEKLICRTQTQFTVPTKPSTFAMTLRKYLLNGTISSITQHEFDRIIKITIHKKQREYTLVFELFKKGNIVLVGPEGTIILPLITQRWAHRTIKPHEIYTPPPSQTNPFTLQFEEFAIVLKKSKRDLVRTLAVDMNLSGTYAEELCLQANIDKNTKIDGLNTASTASIEKLYATLKTVLALFEKKAFRPTYIKEAGEIVDILPFPFLSYKEKEAVQTKSFSLGLQEFIGAEEVQKQEIVLYQENLEKLRRQIIQQNTSIGKFKRNMEQKKREGDLIYLNFQQCQEVLDEIKLVLKQKDKERGIQTINKKPFVKEFDPISNRLVVALPDKRGEKIEVVLAFRKNVAENAEKAYEEGKKFREKMAGAKEAIRNTHQQLELLEKTAALQKREEKSIAVKKFWFESYRWCISSEGNVIIAGKDAKSNERIVKKYLREGDRYVHADVHGASSCVVKSRDIHDRQIPISEQTLQEACIFAACYSKAWKQFGETQAYWVLPEQVSKTPESGDFLPKGAFVIRGKRNYRRCKLELAIGEVTLEGVRKIMSGAPSSVKNQSDKYVSLEPDSTKRNVLIHKLSKAFHVTPDEIMRVLPPGESQIVKTVGVEVQE